jgi:hypothetical protein
MPPTQWLNLTGFPPIYTGVSTIIAPNPINENTACVTPSTIWSCALPKESQQAIAPNNPDQPDFRIEIRWRNDSTTNETFANVSGTKNKRMLAGNPVSAAQFVRRMLSKARSTFTDTDWTPVPDPPSYEDQNFIGNTTDNIASGNKAGEATPFYISFLSATASQNSSSKLIVKRQDGDNSTNGNGNNTFPDLASLIPDPPLEADGTVGPANLLPFPVLQPVKLYDRGLPTEHYGFYTYYDRSIFLKSTSSSTETDPDDLNGGSSKSEAKVRCTWAQTRFLIQIWTRKGGSTSLIGASSPSRASSLNIVANDFTKPGSFPYPVTITLDRHGGDIIKKEIYCWGLDGSEKVIPNSEMIQVEHRGAGGQLVGGGQGPLGTGKVTIAQGGMGGIDGGTGGCQCLWQNFVNTS